MNTGAEQKEKPKTVCIGLGLFVVMWFIVMVV